MKVVQLSVSGENFGRLVSLNPGDEVRIVHVGNTTQISLSLNYIVRPARRMSLSDIEDILGYKVEIVY